MTYTGSIERLSQLPAEIESAAAKLNAANGAHRRGDGWSALEILGHLQRAAAVYQQRIDRVVNEEEPFLPAYNQDDDVAGSNYNTADPAQMIATIKDARAGMIATLRGLGEEGWQRAGTHEEEGRVTVEWLAQHVVDHEEEHLRDLRAAASATP